MSTKLTWIPNLLKKWNIRKKILTNTVDVNPAPGQVRSPEQGKWPYLKNAIAPWLIFLKRINIKLSGVGKGIRSYKTYSSEFWFRKPEVRSMLWPQFYKAMGKCWNVLYFGSTSGSMLFISRYSYIRPFSMTHMQFDPMTSPSGYSRSCETKLVFASTFDRMEI